MDPAPSRKQRPQEPSSPPPPALPKYPLEESATERVSSNKSPESAASFIAPSPIGLSSVGQTPQGQSPQGQSPQGPSWSAQAQDLVLAQVLSALDVLALEWKTARSVEVIGDSPDWLAEAFEFVCLQGEPFEAPDFSPFFDNFLSDAQAFWTSGQSGSLRSGIWTETGTSGHEIHLEAIALSSADLALENRHIVLIESSELMGSEKYQWLQIARQEQLDFIAERKESEAKVLNATFYDELTALPNRSFFLSKLETFFEKSQWTVDRQFAVVILNIDRFQHINNNIGSASGDQILIAVAKRIQSCLRRHDVPVRFGADEFGVLVAYTEDEEAVLRLVQRLLDSIHKPLIIDGQKTYFTASAGIAMRELWYQTARDLLRDAGLAMQQAKSAGLGQYTMFQPEMRSRAFEMWNLESDLHTAIEQGELQLWYQPIVNLQTNRIESFEALIRWLHPTLGWISPTKFIPLAEETGLILAIDSWVLNTACQALKQWQAVANHDIEVNINISPQHFTQGDLVTEVKKTLTASQISPSSLRLEITESLLLDDTQVAINTLNRLKLLGVEVAIDDFGTGYASLSYLQDLPLNKLKIDGYFIEMMEKNGSEIVNTVISLAHKLGFGVTAERVETIKQYKTLRDLGCDTVQGYLFSKPVPMTDAQNLLDAEFVISA